jgi:orotate phosphoribosyltransferase
MTVAAGRAARADEGAAPSDRDRARLADIIYARSFGRGRITLASGKESDFYFDLKPSMLHPEGASLMAKALLRLIGEVGAEYVGGLEMGAVPITGAICQHSHDSGAPVAGFFVRKQAKGHGAKKLIEGLAEGETLAGKRVVVVEDVTTTGESAFKAVEPCREAGAEVVLVVTVVDREDGAKEFFASKGVPFAALFSASEFLSREP